MKKKISLSAQGRRADIRPYIINRIVPNRYVEAVGPFVFLDHALPMKHLPGELPKKANGQGAHPHRGIATLTYMFNGEAVHLDSAGHYARVGSGGVQWMKAGNGIIHDEVVNADTQTGDLLTHALQFWINLPAKNKAELPEYLPVSANEVPQKQFKDGSGWLKVVVGEYEDLASKIPDYSRQFIYHIYLEAGKQLVIPTEKGLEYAAFLPLKTITINDTEYKKDELILFDKNEGVIEISNTSDSATDIILFGGETYSEPIVAQGPFVMNTQHEISEAYNDYHEGKYGEIDYSLAAANR
ncbi:MAG: Pirin-like protein [Sediminibacterium sp.]|nr:Pirin-like protein [Sediminibacterium sp.]